MLFPRCPAADTDSDTSVVVPDERSQTYTFWVEGPLSPATRSVAGSSNATYAPSPLITGP